MPSVQRSLFRVRHYECDRNGRLQYPNYLRYMQETGIEASIALGFPLDEYEARDRAWIIRRTTIQFHGDLRYGDAVEVSTWVEGLRRVQANRVYEIRSRGDGSLAARGSTDWAYLEASTGRPAAITEDLIDALFPEGSPNDRPPAAAFPPIPEAPSGAIVVGRRVGRRDIDPYGHANNAAYLDFMLEAEASALDGRGWGRDQRQAAGFDLAIGEVWLAYHAPAARGDELQIATWSSQVSSSGGLRHFRIAQAADGSPMAEGTISWVSNDPQTGERVALPRAFRRDSGAHETG